MNSNCQHFMLSRMVGYSEGIPFLNMPILRSLPRFCLPNSIISARATHLEARPSTISMMMSLRRWGLNKDCENHILTTENHETQNKRSTEFTIKPQTRNFVCCGLMGWDLIRLVMPMAGIELQIAADVHSYPLLHDAA